MKDIDIFVICDGRDRDLKDFMINIQSQMDEPRLVRYFFVVHDKATISDATNQYTCWESHT